MTVTEPDADLPPAFAAAGAWQATLFLGVVTLILGLIVSFHPSGALNVIAVLLGILLVVAGIFHLVRMFNSGERHRAWLGISGLLLIVIGVMLIRHLHLTVAIIGLVVGISWIVQGLSALINGLSGDSREGRGWWIFFGIVSLTGGIVVTAVPVSSVTVLAVLVGIWFVIQGLCEIIAGFMLRHAIGKSQTTMVNPPRAGEGAAALLPGPGSRQENPMGQAIGGSLPLAVGVALSPIPIIAVVLMLTTGRARTNGPALVLGWLAGLGIVGAIVLVIAGPADASGSGAPATWVSWLKIVLGILLLLVAVRQFRRRPRGEEQAAMPRWMGAIDGLKPAAALGAGAALAAANPKNLLLAVGGAATIAQTGISGAQQAIAFVVFAVIGTAGVGIPVIIYFAMGKRSAEILDKVKNWMGQHNAVIMSVLCLPIGAKLIGDAVGALS